MKIDSVSLFTAIATALLSSCGGDSSEAPLPDSKVLLTIPEGAVLRRQKARGERVVAIVVASGKQFVLDGANAHEPHDECASLILSDDGRRLAYTFRTGATWRAHIDGQTIEEVSDRRINVSLGPSGRFAFTVTRGQDVFMRVVDQTLGPFLEVDLVPEWNAEGTLLFESRARDGWFLNVGTERFGPYEDISSLLLSKDRRRFACAVRRDHDNEAMLVDGEVHEFHWGVTLGAFSADGKVFAYGIRDASRDGLSSKLWVNGTLRSVGGRGISAVALGAGGSQVAYDIDDEGNRIRIVVDGRESKPMRGSLVADEGFDSQGRFSCVIRNLRDDQEFVFHDGKAAPTYDSVHWLERTAHGVAYVARRGKKEFVVHHGREHKPVKFVDALRVSDEGHLLWIEDTGNNKKILHFGDAQSQPFTWIEKRSFAFDGDLVGFTHSDGRVLRRSWLRL